MDPPKKGIIKKITDTAKDVTEKITDTAKELQGIILEDSEKHERYVEYRSEKALLNNPKYFFRCSLCGEEYGPIEVNQGQEVNIEFLANRFLNRCEQCWRWVDEHCFSPGTGLCKLCHEKALGYALDED